MADIEYCEWMTGFPIKFYDFIASFETTGAAVEFYSSAPVEVDWGGGKFLNYEKGVIHGYQINTNSESPVVVRASQPVESFRFGSGIDYDRGYLECHIHKAFDLISANKLCYRLEEMHTFSFFGTNKVKDFTSAWEDCTELTEFDGMDTTEAESFFRSWKNCSKLRTFPSIYSRVTNTVEEAWMGCTEMTVFPIIGSENCYSFKSAWRGNIKLVDFPLIDVSKGKDFDHAWAYCIDLLDFPALDFSSAENMDYAFAYNYKIRTLPFFNTGLGQRFNSTFEKCVSLECIAGIDTRAITSDNGVLNSVDMFKDDCTLVNPNETQQAEIMVGSYYQNENECYFDAGRSVFYAVATTNAEPGEVCNNLNLCSFTVTGGDVDIDWGDGIFIPHNTGSITGLPIDTGIIHIRSEEPITSIRFETDTYYTISIKRGKTLTTCDEMCRDLTMLQEFSILGNMYATDYSHILDGCMNLIDVHELDVSHVETLNSAFKDCTRLTMLSEGDIIDVSKCKDFTSTFEGCHAITKLGVLTTTLGELFIRTFKDCFSLTCIFGIDTRNQTDTTDMFLNTPLLTRPNVNEQPRILAGTLYNNNGNCSSTFSLIFTATGSYDEVSFTVDTEIDIDWGDGHYVKAGPGIITGTPTGVSYAFGPVEAISFETPATFEEITFISGDLIKSFANTFEGMTNLTTFQFIGYCGIETWNSAFKDCTALEYFYCSGYAKGWDYTSMFQNCGVLTNVNNMNTLEGTEFEYMYSNCLSLNLVEINTLKGNFEKYYIDCDVSLFDCDTGLVPCEPGSDLYSCTVYYNCDPATGDVFPCFASSTMFENWTIDQIPKEADRIAIMSKVHWKDGEIL